MTLRSYGDALADLSTAMLEVHEQTCEIQPAHRWERCTDTPTIFAMADALDEAHKTWADRPDGVQPGRDAVAVALHDRECDRGLCTARHEHAIESWGDQAVAVLRWVAEQKDTPLPPVAALRGDLMVMCECDHIRRGHSVDGTRCYASPCDCAVHGGFRPKRST